MYNLDPPLACFARVCAVQFEGPGRLRILTPQDPPPSRILAPGSWPQDPGLRILASGSWHIYL